MQMPRPAYEYREADDRAQEMQQMVDRQPREAWRGAEEGRKRVRHESAAMREGVPENVGGRAKQDRDGRARDE